MSVKKIIVMDFDGVIHSYKSGWKGVDVIPDEPVPGVKEFINNLRRDYQVYVLSSRTNDPFGLQAVKRWLEKYKISVDDVVDHKPPAYLTIDDRCICFTGDFNGLRSKIDSFEPWTKKEGDK